MHSDTPITDAATGSSTNNRKRLFDELTARVDALKAEGRTERAAIRRTADRLAGVQLDLESGAWRLVWESELDQ